VRRRGSGFSLVETMVALALLGVTIVAVLSAFSSAAIATNRHRMDANLDRLVRSDAEFIKRQAYVPKPPPAGAYANLAAPAGYAFAIQVWYYSPGPVPARGFAAANPERGLQQITLTATAPGGATERVIFLKVRP
jgi:prepilin-type N-terminal cleavage/methylation domain-containing protein